MRVREDKARSIVLVTGNAAKAEIAGTHLAAFGYVVRQKRLAVPEIQSLDPSEVVAHKAREAFNRLGRELIVEDFGLAIEELADFPGALVKFVLSSMGPQGLCVLGDQTTSRSCRFLGALAHVDSQGAVTTFSTRGRRFTRASRPAPDLTGGAWSPLWTVIIPPGCQGPISAEHALVRERFEARWQATSVYAKLGAWLTGTASADARHG